MGEDEVRARAWLGDRLAADAKEADGGELIEREREARVVNVAARLVLVDEVKIRAAAAEGMAREVRSMYCDEGDEVRALSSDACSVDDEAGDGLNMLKCRLQSSCFEVGLGSGGRPTN